jgi:hypothetical protein
VKLGITLLAGASAAAIVPVAYGTSQGASGPETTAPPPIVTIKVNITDSRISIVPKRAQRGVMARFVLINTGKQAHTFKLGNQKHGNAIATGFTAPVKPSEQAVKLYYLDYRGKLPYQGSNKADLKKPGMRGVFIIF